MRYLRAALWAAACCIAGLPTVALAQGSVQQSGASTAGQIPMYVGNGRVIATGGALSAGASPENQTNAGTLPSGIAIANSGQGLALYSAYGSTYSQFKLGFDGSGNGLITVGSIGGAPPECNFLINGTLVPCGGGASSATAITASGASTPVTLALLGQRIIDVDDFGALGDGTTDDAAAINSAVAWAQGNGGGLIRFTWGKRYAIASTVAVTGNAVGLLCGAPAGSIAGVGCTLRWTGASGGRMLSFAAPNSGGGGNTRLAGNSVKGFKFDGNGGLAADGLYLQTVFGGRFEDLLFVGNFNGGNVVNLDVVQTTTGFTDTPTTQNNILDNIGIYSSGGTSNGLKLGAYVANDGTATNASYNRLGTLFIQSGAGTGLLCLGCDNNWFNQVRVYTNGGVPSVDLSIAASALNGHLFAANGNIFDHLYYSQTMVARGTTSFPSCAVFSLGGTVSCSYLNEVRGLDKSNGVADPTIETGAQLVWGDDIGRRYGQMFIGKDGVRPGVVVVEDLGQTNTCGNSAVTNGGAGTTTYLCNASTGPFIQFDNLNGSRIAVQQGLASSSNLVVQALAGTGKLEFALTTQFDAAPLPISSLGVDIGSATLRFGTLNAKSLTSNNGSNVWVADTNLAASADGDFTLSHNGTTYLTVNRSGPLTGMKTAFASLPGCVAGLVGSYATVTDSNTAVWGATVAAGGANVVLAFCGSGSVWTVAGKGG